MTKTGDRSECLPRKAQASAGIRTKRRRILIKGCTRSSRIPEATYYYKVKQLKKEDPDKEWKGLILELFQHKEAYGYRRIYLGLRHQS